MSNNNLKGKGQRKGEGVDRLSQLPEPLLLLILSFLPTKFAVRTSLVARCFRHLWTASPSFELDCSDFPPGRRFNDATSRCLRLRDPSAPLLRFCLKTEDTPLLMKRLPYWLKRAHSLGMRDLSLHIHSNPLGLVFPLILSFGSLRFLHINVLPSFFSSFRLVLPPTFPLTQLKCLYSKAMSNFALKTFIMEQTSLECLCIEKPTCDTLDLSSQSVKILKLSFESTSSKICLSFPKLEFLDLRICLSDDVTNQFYGEMPELRKASVEISSLMENWVSVLCDILKTISNVSELTLQIGESRPMWYFPGSTYWRQNGFDLFHPLVEPGKDMLMFPNLRSLKLSMCFYGNALQDLICLLHHSPVIDSLHLIHVEGPSNYQRTLWVPEAWHSKLPLNSEGNRNYAHFLDLQTCDKKSEVIKLLSSEKSSKRQKT